MKAQWPPRLTYRQRLRARRRYQRWLAEVRRLDEEGRPGVVFDLACGQRYPPDTPNPTFLQWLGCQSWQTQPIPKPIGIIDYELPRADGFR